MDQPRSSIHPIRLAGVLAGTYVVTCGLYIWLSGLVVAQLSQSLADLQRFELAKGLGFIVVTGGLLFAITWYLFGRIADNELRILQQRNALIASEQRAMAGMFAASTAHDINNVLTVLQLELEELVGSSASDGSARKLRSDLDTAVANLRQLSERLMTIGRRWTPGDTATVDIDSVLQEGLTLCRNHAVIRRCNLRTPPATGLVMNANATAIKQIVFNLVLNAAEAVQGQGAVEVQARPEDGQFVLEVHDSGPGIADETASLIFEPFFTTKPQGQGIGLLSVKACAELHKGRVSVERSTLLGGACFRVAIPLEPDRPGRT